MKTNTKIHLLVTALTGSAFSHSAVRASDSPEYTYERPGTSFTSFRFEPPQVSPYSCRGYLHTRRQVPDQTSRRIPRGIPLSASCDSFVVLQKELEKRPEGLSRKPTISGVLSQLSNSDLIPVDQQERGLGHLISTLIRKNFFDAFPAFVNLTVEGFKQANKRGEIDECSLEEFFNLSLVDSNTFQYVTRDSRPARESVAIYGYAIGAIMAQDGIINRIKRNIMDEIITIFQSLITANLPDGIIEQLEDYINHLLEQIVPSLKQIMFEILRSDEVAEVATGCCGWCKKLKKKDKENLTRGICHMMGGMLGTVFGEGFERGANELAEGICGIINTGPGS